MNAQIFWAWFAFALSCGGYVPLAIGAYFHPKELNMATYGIWTILSVLMVYSAVAQKYPGWRMQFGWLVGNILMLGLATGLGQFTFNLEPTEAIVLYSTVIAVGIWITAGRITGKMNPRILFLGTVLVDMFSFYPLIKQYVLPHDPPTIWFAYGLWLFFAGALCNLVAVEEMFRKFCLSAEKYHVRYGEPKLLSKIVETSAISLENTVLILVVILVMT